LKCNGAPISAKCPEGVSKEVLDYCIRIGIDWGDKDQVRIELGSLGEVRICEDLKGLICDYVTIAQ